MKILKVYVEIEGKQIQAGELMCININEARFVYLKEYLQMSYSAPISISLPLQEKPFSTERTQNFFEGLLPEGFTRKSVAQWMHVREEDYIAILVGLGNECLGAIRVTDESSENIESSYEKLDKKQVAELAREGATKSTQLVTKAHLSLTGASGKVGLYYDDSQDEWYLPMGEAPSTHIVKQSHIRLDGIVTNEQLCLMTAKKLGIQIPESFIINVGNADEGDVLFATKRYDRAFSLKNGAISGKRRPFRLHQEDFAQAMGKSSAEKYEKSDDGYLKSMFELLAAYSSNPIEDQLRLWDIMIYDYLVGNTDNHIKNLSLLYDNSLKGIRLAPAYDIISTTIYENSTRDMGIAIGGEICIDSIHRSKFIEEAGNVGIGQKTAMKHFDEMCEQFETALNASVEVLQQKGFYKAEKIGKKILETGGIAKQI